MHPGRTPPILPPQPDLTRKSTRSSRDPGRPSSTVFPVEAVIAAARGHKPKPRRSPPRFAVVDQLDRQGLLPAIVFIFSRAGCEDAVDQVRHAGIVLTTEEQRERIRQIVDTRCAGLGSRGPRRTWVRRVARSARGGACGPPRRAHSAVQGSGGGTLRRRTDQGGVRHRNARAWHQHARAFRGAREVGQVGWSRPQGPHGGGVHPVDGSRRAPGYRHRGTRGGD